MTDTMNAMAASPKGSRVVETVHLLTLVGYTAADIAAASRPFVFEQLLRLSYRDVRSYWSDYFHDARWLAEHLNTVPFSFAYWWSRGGTWIANADAAPRLISTWQRSQLALVTVRVHDHRVLVDIERVDAACAPQADSF